MIGIKQLLRCVHAYLGYTEGGGAHHSLVHGLRLHIQMFELTLELVHDFTDLKLKEKAVHIKKST